MDKECSNCAYWDWQGGEFKNEGIGRCRRYPPVLMAGLLKKFDSVYNDNIVNFFTYPMTVDSDTCGEWKYDINSTNY
jgi:hypothetical protein